ncbi:hypothetical protein BIY24_08865 [Halobacteriovorax marinus]|uniref:hypothetical protein n=1 Tax=Halobacteriovorax marinus TaxID=97084 RepID=UPI000BC35B99|nr:hypothetical protein [Halobacteriovorax marinus]ATH08059.1 hypothetical protein BIY24_08865 [Halobacteriovorax marinus]
MKLLKIKSSILILTMALTLCLLPKNTYAMDARAKALGSMALYGTVGGALLGAASLAFGTSGRAVAQGASLGLYGGIIFGSYVVISHSMRKSRYNAPAAPANDNYYPEDGNTPYNEAAPNSNGGGSDGDSWSFYNRVSSMKEYSADFGLDMKSIERLENKKGPTGPMFYMNLLNFQF